MPSSPPHPSTPYPSGELLTRQWLNPILVDPFESDSVNSVKRFQSYKEGATKTKQKLNELHERLGNHKKLLLLQQRILDPIGTVDWLREKVGIWHIVKEWNEDRWAVSRWTVSDELLPRQKLPRYTLWDIVAWGEEEKENGLLLIMLSPQCVEWLNIISDWVGE